jgi:hypothetical protein
MAKKKEQRIENIDFNGKKMTAVQQDYTVEREGYGVYRLKDGSSIKVRIVIDEIFLTKEKNDAGEPLALVKQAIIASYQAPPSNVTTKIKKPK